MAERGGMLFGDGPTACPFVALESDRDHRADEPDHRHRCYAEPEPAPRAIAHQRAFCLSPTFTGCPIFQDWAVRAGARRVQTRPGGVVASTDVAPAGMTPDWAAPPPWAGRNATDDSADEPEQLSAFDAGSAKSPESRPAVPPDPPQAQPIERVPSLPVAETGNAERDAEVEAERQRRMLAERERRTEEERRRRADEERRDRERQAAAAAVVPPFLAGRTEGPDREATSATRATTPMPRSPSPQTPPSQQPEPGRQSGRPPRDEWAARREDLVPVWERQPIQGYRTRSRVWFGGSGDTLSTITTLLAVLAVIALVVFMVVALPSLLGGGDAPGRTTPPLAGGSPIAGAATGSAPTPTPATTAPRQTPRTYTVLAGDTLFGIATKFGLTVDQVLAANPSIVDANYLTIGQVIAIPDRDSPVPSGGATPTG